MNIAIHMIFNRHTDRQTTPTATTQQSRFTEATTSTPITVVHNRLRRYGHMIRKDNTWWWHGLAAACWSCSV